MPLADLNKRADLSKYDESVAKDMPEYPGLALTSHVLLKNVQLWSTVGSVASLGVWLKSPDRSVSSLVLKQWPRFAGLGGAAGVVMTLPMMYMKMQNVDLDGLEDRTYRIALNKGVQTVDFYSAIGGVMSLVLGLSTRSRVESEEEQTDSEDDEYLDDIDLQPTTVPKKIVRRESVSAEQVGANTKQPELKIVPKSDEESTRIHEILRENILFKHLDLQQTDQVKDAMFLVQHEPDDVVIREGDAGDNFYVIDEGTFDVYIKKEGVETKVKSLGPGESFGELALMYSTPRSATCKAVTKARLWALDRISFKIILQATTTARRKQHKSFLESVPTLEQLTEYEILTIADALVEDSYEDGDVICTQGEVGDAFYIIKKGSASVIQTDALGESQEIAHLDMGHYFGEVALIFAQPRGATVKAVGPLQLLSLDRRTFKRVMGPMETILKRNMKAYKRIAASNI